MFSFDINVVQDCQTYIAFMIIHNHDIYPGSSTHCEVVFREVLHLDRIGIWKCWFLGRGENRSTRRKTSRSRVENQQQTQPVYDVESGNQTRATLVGGECFHHCANPATQIIVIIAIIVFGVVIISIYLSLVLIAA